MSRKLLIQNAQVEGIQTYEVYRKHGGYNDYRGGGHFSGRITVGIVAAGVVAKKLLHGMEVTAKVLEAGGQEDGVEAAMAAQRDKDSVGALVEVRVSNVIAGLGEPTTGDVVRSRGLRLGYVEQDVPKSLMALSMRDAVLRFCCDHSVPVPPVGWGM